MGSSVKGSYFSVYSPDGTKTTLFGETKFDAIAKAVKLDGFIYSNSQYTAIKIK